MLTSSWRPPKGTKSFDLLSHKFLPGKGNQRQRNTFIGEHKGPTFPCISCELMYRFNQGHSKGRTKVTAVNNAGITVAHTSGNSIHNYGKRYNSYITVLALSSLQHRRSKNFPEQPRFCKPGKFHMQLCFLCGLNVVLLGMTCIFGYCPYLCDPA